MIGGLGMKTAVTLLILLVLFSINTFAQDSPQWHLPDGAKARLGKGSISEIQYSPDGTRLAVAGSIGIWLYDTTTYRELALLTGHTSYTNRVECVAFSPDGRTLASGNGDNTIRLRHAITGRHIRTLTGHTSGVESVSFSPDGRTLASGSGDGTVLLWDIAPTLSITTSDVNGDGVVNVIDLALVASWFGRPGQSDADVNGDGVVNIDDLIQVASVIDSVAQAPQAQPVAPTTITPADVQGWIAQAKTLNRTDAMTQRGIRLLEQLLAVLMPKETTLLPNYPNPFNPETWIPYHLANATDVQISIYDINGVLVRELDLGHQSVGFYTDRTKAAYWDGRNALGEPVVSGVYFYHLSAGDYSQVRRMVILK